MSAWSIAARNLLTLNEWRDVDCNTEIDNGFAFAAEESRATV